jgi:WD40 repeat protein
MNTFRVLTLASLILTAIGSALIAGAMRTAPGTWHVLAGSQARSGGWSALRLDLDRGLQFTAFSNWRFTGRPIVAPQGRSALWVDSSGRLMRVRRGRAETLPILGVSECAWSPEGSTLACAALSGSIRLYRADQPGWPQIAAVNVDPHTLTDLRWSPDGSRLVFIDRLNNDTDILLIDAQGEGRTAITSNYLTAESGAAWSPDGSRLAYLSDQRTHQELRVYDHASGEDTILVSSPADFRRPAWSPDGSQIAFGTDEGQLLVISVGPGARPQPILYAPPPQTAPILWSPDSQHLIYTSSRDNDLYVVRVSGFDIRRLTDNDSFNTLLP